MSAPHSFFHRQFTLGQSLAWLGMILALLTLGAHFYRASEYGLTLCMAGSIAFACARSRWKQYAVAFILLWGVIEWAESACLLARMRMVMGMPWIRGAAILCAVGLLTGLAGFYAFKRAERNCQDKVAEEHPLFQGVIFIFAFLTLVYMRQAMSMHFLLLERFFPTVGSVQIFFAAWYTAFVAGKLSDPKQSRKTRKYVWLFFGTVFFLQFFLGVLGFEQILMTGKLHVPIPAFIIFAPVFRESFSMMPFIVLTATLLAGSAWCSILCYFGPFDSLAAGKKAVKPYSPFIHTALHYGRPAILVCGCLGAVGLRMVGIRMGTAISIAIAFAVVNLMIMTMVSRNYSGMIHCTTFCPMGWIVALLGKISPWRVRVDVTMCDNCRSCEKICKYFAITQESRAAGKTLTRCTLCRDCITVCARKAVFLSCPGLSRHAAWMVFTGFITVLHVLFLNIAMV